MSNIKLSAKNILMYLEREKALIDYLLGEGFTRFSSGGCYSMPFGENHSIGAHICYNEKNGMPEKVRFFLVQEEKSCTVIECEIKLCIHSQKTPDYVDWKKILFQDNNITDIYK